MICLLHVLVLQGRHDNVRALPLDPPASRHIGVAVPSLKETTPVIRQFILGTRKKNTAADMMAMAAVRMAASRTSSRQDGRAVLIFSMVVYLV